MTSIQTIIDKILANRVGTHVLYWTASVLLWAVVGTFGNDNKLEPLVNKLCYLPSQLIATYLLLYYQIPKLIDKKKYVRFILSFLLSMYVTTVLARILKIYVYEPVLNHDLAQDSIINILTQIGSLTFQYALWVYLFPFFTLIVKLVKDHFEEKQRIEVLKKEKAAAELGFLKAQLHPHFLFNTLNNLYTLTLYKSDEAPEIVRKLAEMLDYTLYQEQGTEISIPKEVALIQNYIDLELLRYGERLDFKFSHQIDTPHTKVAPLILLSMVENAFKHGASGDHERPQIHIDLQVKKEQLHFEVFNTKPKVVQADTTNIKKGIGLKNIKRQLVLLYPEQHTLRIVDRASTYKVILNINLANTPRLLAI